MKLKWSLSLALVPFCVAGLSAQVSNRDRWSSFRGERASGVAEGHNLPERWDGQKGVNVKWKTRIPGLAHSSPIVWGNRVFVTTAISSRGGDSFRHGLYGDGTASED
ncbi:MAG: PQQ-binding-like beta-propeller repeat protein, partial [Acidobacteria bacterium]|nr:PQQ-binding-like beta-propeller repeat protein [Acidobacteriota bacterium]